MSNLPDEKHTIGQLRDYFEENIIKEIKHISNEVTQLRLLLLEFMEKKDV